jgi:sulfoxide reductase catalytic subunit YedY|tara:strand:+ start:4372 stop:5322 length:951 start_codon:yes stop_codon:yes gene_type:complete
MLIKIPARHALKESAVTDYSVYLQRREFIKKSLATGGAIGLSAAGLPAIAGVDLSAYQKAADQALAAELTAEKSITSYNNFYELGTDKKDPEKNAAMLKTEPWSVTIEGECERPGVIALEDLIQTKDIEERIYRLRCVEAWSMVIPWMGVELGPLLQRFKPTSKAKYVEFTTLHDPANLPGQRFPVLDWPYVEGLRIDEAMNPLSLLVVGLYGKQLPNQNGAPLRLVVPWKYGFKSIKSIVKIRFSETQPETSWNLSAAKEYGFYSNVNPEVNHPRWSQARERRIGEFRKRKTLPFNGYAEQVAALYSGMDLKRNF